MNQKTFNGSIGRLYIVAAPTGSGKSTFLSNSEKLLPVATTPHALLGLHNTAPSHIPLRLVDELPNSYIEELCVHIDLTFLVRLQKLPTRNKKKFISQLSPEIFASHPVLQQLIQNAAAIQITTLFVRQREHYHRCTQDRKLSKEAKILLTDTSNKSAGHRKLYQAWHQYTATIGSLHGNCERHYLDTERRPFKLMRQADYENEINHGYKFWPQALSFGKRKLRAVLRALYRCTLSLTGKHPRAKALLITLREYWR